MAYQNKFWSLMGSGAQDLGTDLEAGKSFVENQQEPLNENKKLHQNTF